MRGTNQHQQNILDGCRQILIDLSDDGVEFECRCMVADFRQTCDDVVEVSIGNMVDPFDPRKYIGIFEHLNSFLEDEGYTYWPAGTVYNDFDSRMKGFEGNHLFIRMKWVN